MRFKTPAGVVLAKPFRASCLDVHCAHFEQPFQQQSSPWTFITCQFVSNLLCSEEGERLAIDSTMCIQNLGCCAHRGNTSHLQRQRVSFDCWDLPKPLCLCLQIRLEDIGLCKPSYDSSS
jgi:hypothetical protein